MDPLPDPAAPSLAGELDLSTVAQLILEHADTMVVLTDRHGTIRYVNPAFTRVTGYSSEEAVGGNPRLLRSGVQDDAFYEQLWGSVLANVPWHGELVNRRKDGRLYTDAMTILPLGATDSHGPTHFLAVKRDVTAQLEELTASSPVGLAHAGRAGNLLYVNARAESLLGGSFQDLVGLGWLDRFEPEDRLELLELLDETHRGVLEEAELVATLQNRRTVAIRIAPLRAGRGDRLGLVVSFEDVTEATAARAELAFVASHDAVTGLLNRAAFEEVLAERFAARGDDDPIVLVFVDLDGFKEVNDRFGHAAGDRILETAARRLRTVVRGDDVVARVGGDEFVLLITSPDARRIAFGIAERIDQAIEAPIVLEGASTTIGASAGVAYGRPGDTAHTLLERADARMYAAKRERTDHGGVQRLGRP